MRIIILSLAMMAQIGLSSQANLDSLLIGYWPFNGNSLDESLFSNDGVNFGCELTEDHLDNSDSAYLFADPNDHLEIPSSNYELTVPFTICAWVYKDNYTEHQHIFSSASTTGSYSGVYLGVNLDGQAQVTYGDGGPVGENSRRTLNTDDLVPIAEWMHVVAVVNGPEDMFIYINDSIWNGTYSGSGGALENGDGLALIGRAAHNPESWRGKIDEVRLYNRALSAQEVKEVCQANATNSIGETQNKAELKLFPNPCSEFIHVSSNRRFTHFVIHDLQGNELRKTQVSKQYFKVDTSSLPSGSYVISFFGEGYISRRIIVLGN